MKENLVRLGISFGESANELEAFIEDIFNNINLFSDATVEESKELIDFLPDIGGFEKEMFNQVLDKAAMACTNLTSPRDEMLVDIVTYFFTKKMLATFLESYDDYANDLAKLEKRAKLAPQSKKGYKHQILSGIMAFVKKGN